MNLAPFAFSIVRMRSEPDSELLFQRFLKPWTKTKYTDIDPNEGLGATILVFYFLVNWIIFNAGPMEIAMPHLADMII